jgi:geranylgeranyl pyrophosphate synthase
MAGSVNRTARKARAYECGQCSPNKHVSDESTAGKDIAARKATYPSIVGLEKSRKIATELTRRAFAALKVFRGKAEALEALGTYLLQRNR